MKYLIALVSSWFVMATGLAEPFPKEMAVRGNYNGHWEITIAGSPDARGNAVGEYTLWLQFVQVTWSLEAIPGGSEKVSGTTIMGFDRVKRVYRMSRFVSDGSSGSGEGVWDEATRTLTWTLKDPGNGQSPVLKSTFGEDRSETWERSTAGSDGKAISVVRGKNVSRSRAWPQDKPAVVLEKFGAFTITDDSS